jgi:hypothetical protein
MAQVTGGTVSVEDGLKKQEEYAPPRKVIVVLNFQVAEGEDYQSVFDAASHAATNRVHSLLHGKPFVTTVAQEPAGVEQPASETTAPKPPRKRRTAAEIAAAGGVQTSTGSGGGQTSDEDPTGNVENVIHLPDEGAVEDDTFDIEPEPEAPAEESFDIEPDAGAEDITDADLNNAVQKKNAEIANPNAIRALIGTYNPDPKAAFQLRQITAAKRAEFLKKLGELKKAA